MSQPSILNADMATIAGWLRQGARWWVDTVADMLPVSLRGGGSSKAPLALFDQGAITMIRGESGTPERPRPADLGLSADRCLIRERTLPAMSQRDLDGFVAIESDRLFPFADGSLLVASRVTGRLPEQGSITVELAAIPRDLAEAAVVAAQGNGIAPRRVGIAPASPDSALRFDVAPALRAEGLLPPPGNARAIWWSIVAALVLLNIGIVIWRDRQSVEQLREIVAEQQPAVTVYRAIAGRSARLERVAASTVQRRRRQDALGDLAAATAALPDSAWVQRYEWDGRTLRLSGYLRPPVDVVAALGRDRRFANVRAGNGDVQAELPIGEPFDIVADLHGGRR